MVIQKATLLSALHRYIRGLSPAIVSALQVNPICLTNPYHHFYSFCTKIAKTQDLLTVYQYYIDIDWPKNQIGLSLSQIKRFIFTLKHRIILILKWRNQTEFNYINLN